MEENVEPLISEDDVRMLITEVRCWCHVVR